MLFPQVLISEDTYASSSSVLHQFVSRPIDVVVVKGRSTPTRVFEVLGTREDLLRDRPEVIKAVATHEQVDVESSCLPPAFLPIPL
jgi:class 3 adenylate cyclase